MAPKTEAEEATTTTTIKREMTPSEFRRMARQHPDWQKNIGVAFGAALTEEEFKAMREKKYGKARVVVSNDE